MKQKTAMQILIDELEVDAKNANGFYSNYETCIIKNIISNATRLLPTERGQIEEAVNEGQIYNDGFVYKDGADYYQQKYGS